MSDPRRLSILMTADAVGGVWQYATDLSAALIELGHRVTLALLAVGAVLYALFTPWKEIALIREGNAAAAVAYSGVLIGLAIPLAVSLSVSTSIKDITLWGAATVVLQLLAVRLVDMVLTGLPQRIREGEVAAAVLLVGAKLATALILAAALTG